MKDRVTSRLEDDGRISVISFNDPEKLNSLSFKDLNHIGELLQWADHKTKVQVTLLQSTGKFFSAGGKYEDINYIKDDVSSHPERLFGHLSTPNVQLVNRFMRHRKPLVCCLNGPAVGMTAALVQLCDIVYAKDNSVYLLFPFANLGFVPEGGTSVTIPWKLGINNAYEHLVMCSPVTAQELLDTHVVSKVYHSRNTSSFNNEVLSDIARTISSLSPQSLVSVKNILNTNPQIKNWLTSAQSLETNTTFPFWSSGEPFKRFAQLQRGSRKHKL